MIAQFGCDRRGWSGSADKIEFALLFACSIFSAGHAARQSERTGREPVTRTFRGRMDSDILPFLREG